MDTTVDRKFGCTIDTLKAAAKNINGGLNDVVYGDAVTSRMKATFKADYEANVTALVKAMADQAIAKGTVTELARDLRKKLDKCANRTSTLRSLAKRDFADEDALLHSEFTVGISAPRNCESIVTRAEAMHAACIVHAEALENAGWPATETTALAAAIADVNAAKEALHVAKEAKKGATATVTTLANSLYDWCRKVQIVANAVYPAADAQTDAQIPEARGRFLLGVFPPSGSAPTTEPSDPPSPAGTSTAPATPPPATGGAA